MDGVIVASQSRPCYTDAYTEKNQHRRSCKMPETPISRLTDSTTVQPATKYVAPRIESVMKPEDLAREVQYAGAVDQTIFIA